ncbi:MAG TPA: ABC transporter substrate-binding protein, partial [Patescibacteria group bacterium]|nr:ABC transporter substrate-binding protein [Patescibacteria group bacterium]
VRGSNFKNWGNTIVSQNTDYNQLVAIFYNTEDPELSDKKLREALSYAIPPKFSEGVRAYSPIRANSIYFAQSPNYGISDISISNDLLSDKSDSKKKTYEIDTTDDLMPVAKVVSDSWKKIGIKTKIKTVDSIPHNFQMLIYPIKLPLDPDQYTLWHSKGENNISNFHKNQRIDKLLEDGRSTNDTEKRILIYSDFQKYLIDEAPATFLYYPQTYSVKKK